MLGKEASKNTMTAILRSISSCRKKNNKWLVAMDKWQTMTDMEVNKGKNKRYKEMRMYAYKRNDRYP